MSCKIRKNPRIYVVLLLVVVLISSGNVFAIGVAPAKVDADYVQDFKVEIPYIIRSNSNGPGYAAIALGGSLAQYASIDKDEIYIGPGETKEFRINLNIPNDHVFVGPQELLVNVYEKAPDSTTGMFIVLTGVEAKVIVRFPYPGNFIEILSVSSSNINEGEVSNAEWTVQSRGSENTLFSSILTVADENRAVLFQRSYDSVLLQAGQPYTKKDSLPTQDLTPGLYLVDLTIKYDEEEKSKQGSFMVGYEDITLIDYIPKEFVYGDINQITLAVRNLWNSGFSKVYADIEIGGIKATTPTIGLDAFAEAELTQFIDTRSLQEGIYEGKATIYFNSNQKVFPLKINVTTPVAPEEVKESGAGMTVLLVAAIILLLGLLVFVLIFLKKKSENKK